MKRVAQPELSAIGESALSHYEQRLRAEEDLSAATVRNYQGFSQKVKRTHIE